MRDPARIPKFLALFEELWKQDPDMRFGQMVSWLAVGTSLLDPDNDIFWDMEESEWLTAIKKRLKQTK